MPPSFFCRQDRAGSSGKDGEQVCRNMSPGGEPSPTGGRWTAESRTDEGAGNGGVSLSAVPCPAGRVAAGSPRGIRPPIFSFCQKRTLQRGFSCPFGAIHLEMTWGPLLVSTLPAAVLTVAPYPLWPFGPSPPDRGSRPAGTEGGGPTHTHNKTEPMSSSARGRPHGAAPTKG